MEEEDFQFVQEGAVKEELREDATLLQVLKRSVEVNEELLKENEKLRK